MSSSPSPSRRRQSVRTPQRRNVDSARRRKEESFDPFVVASWSPSKDSGPSILKQTLLSQLNSRVETDAGNTAFSFSSPFKHHPWNGTSTGTSTFDDKHQRLFKSMKSIASPKTISCNRFASVKANKQGDCNRRVLHSASKRAGPVDHTLGTPNKRRRMDTSSVATPASAPLSRTVETPGEALKEAPSKASSQAVKSKYKGDQTIGKEVKPGSKDMEHTSPQQQTQKPDGAATTSTSSCPLTKHKSAIPRPNDLKSRVIQTSRVRNGSPKRLWR